MDGHDRVDGFTLVETLVAMLLVSTAVAGVAHLGLAAMAQSAAIQREAVALWLAQSRLEELRATQWAFDASGARLSDPALSVSPADALTRDATGYVDTFDRFGEPTVMGPAVTYRRRWAIGLVSPTDPDTLLLQSCVFAGTPLHDRAPADTCLSTIRTRHLQ
jgi:prepilin-type N-terminal cleavage/methylation domain-containing protein